MNRDSRRLYSSPQLDLVEATFIHAVAICRRPDNEERERDQPSAGVNLTFAWSIPNGSGLWKNFLTKGLLDGWHLNGVAAFFSGTPMTVTCAVQSAPIGWPTGIPATPVSRSAAKWSGPCGCRRRHARRLRIPIVVSDQQRQLVLPRDDAAWAIPRRPLPTGRDSRT